MDRAELQAVQKPLKERYRDEPTAALVTLRAHGKLDEEQIACSVETGRALVEAGLHPATDVSGSVLTEGDLDFRGTLGVDRDAPVGFTAIRLRFELASDAAEEELAKLIERTERYCVVGQTLARGVPVAFSYSIS
jgi:hypothetical protein